PDMYPLPLHDALPICGGRQRQRPTFKNAKVLTVTLDYDPALAWYNALVEADALREPVVQRATLPNGVQLYYYVYPSFDGDPSLVDRKSTRLNSSHVKI